MKNILILMLIAILLTRCSKDGNNIAPYECNFAGFKYYNGSQENLGELSNDYILIACDSTYSDGEIKDFISSESYFNQNYDYTIHAQVNYKYKEIPLQLSTSKTCEEITGVISDLQQNPIISYVHYTMKTDDCNDLIGEPVGNFCVNSYSSYFYVKVFDEEDYVDLNTVLSETNTEFVRQNEFMPKWYTLKATKNSTGDALEMANYFYESGLFEHSEPDITKYPVE